MRPNIEWRRKAKDRAENTMSGELKVKLSDCKAALTERDRQWREKVEGLVGKLINDVELVPTNSNDEYNRGRVRGIRNERKRCADELEKLLEDSE